MIFLAKFFILLKKLVTAFFVGLIYYPGRILVRWVFYAVIVKGYRFYLTAIKRLGWSGGIHRGPLSFILNKKLVHAIVAVLTITVVAMNLTAKTRTVSAEEMVGRTFLSEIVSGEFDAEAGELIEEYFDEEFEISPVQQTYLDNLSSVRVQPTAEMLAPDEINTEEAIEMADESGVLVKPDIASTELTKRDRDEIVYYTIKSGDSVSTIAAEFEVSVNTILWANNLSAYSLIRPGQQIKILPASGVLHKVASGENLSYIASKYDVEADEILEANKLVDASKLAVGQELIIPGGRKTTYASANVSTYTGVSAVKDLFAPSDSTPVSGNKMNWPTVGHRITQYYSWRHTGLDIANSMGTPIYAADAGVVEAAGWGTGYGNQILINHGGGKKTRYAHLSKFYVGVGETVDKGQSIGAMGSTGWSTGPHLHFEVIINNQKYNPLNYIR